MGSYRTTVIVVLVLVAAGVGLWWYRAGDSSSSTPSQTKSTGIIEQEISEFRLVETTGPEEVWTLTAPRSTRSGDTTELESPRVVLRQQGDTTAIITSRRGLYNIPRQHLRLEGDVRVNRLRQNQVLTTEVLNWDQSNGTIESDTMVQIESPVRTLRARGLWGDLSEERVRFKSNVELFSR